MRHKKDLLHTIGNKMDISVVGIDNFSTDTPTVIVANHTSLCDIFSVPHALPEAAQIVLSSRLMWKRSTPQTAERRKLIEESLYGIPLEVHGGNRRHEIGLAMARSALHENWPVIIFPEGAYTGNKEVTKGRTGAVRVLFETREEGTEAQLLPVGINTSVGVESLDSLTASDPVTITIGEPIDYTKAYEQYIKAKDNSIKRQALRSATEIAMRSIASLVHQPYIDEYIPIRPRSTVILESGEEVPVNEPEYDIVIAKMHSRQTSSTPQ